MDSANGLPTDRLTQLLFANIWVNQGWALGLLHTPLSKNPKHVHVHYQPRKPGWILALQPRPPPPLSRHP